MFEAKLIQLLNEERDKFAVAACRRGFKEQPAYEAGVVVGRIQGYERAIEMVNALLSGEKERDKKL